MHGKERVISSCPLHPNPSKRKSLSSESARERDSFFGKRESVRAKERESASDEERERTREKEGGGRRERKRKREREKERERRSG